MFIVIGTTTVDLFISGFDKVPHFEHDEFSTSSLAWCSKPLKTTLGGNGANSAYVLAALGAQVALCSAAGQDMLGDTVTGWLRERGVVLDGFVRSRTHGTATTTSLIDDRLNRISFYHPGPLHDLHFEDSPLDLFRRATTLLITGCALLPAMHPDGFRAALSAVRGQGAATAVDIGPAVGKPVALADLQPLLPLTDYLIANVYELAICTGLETVEASARCLLDAGARTLIVKRGADGASVYRPDHETLHVAGFPVKAEVTIGAGDTFNSSLLYALSEGFDLERALAFASAAASIVVTGGRSVLGAPSRPQVEAFLRQHGF